MVILYVNYEVHTRFCSAKGTYRDPALCNLIDLLTLKVYTMYVVPCPTVSMRFRLLPGMSRFASVIC